MQPIFRPKAMRLLLKSPSPRSARRHWPAYAWLNLLSVSANVAVGHSLGEITALHWAGVFDEAALLRIARARGKAMAELGSPTGSMAADSCPSQGGKCAAQRRDGFYCRFQLASPDGHRRRRHCCCRRWLRALVLTGCISVNLAVSHAFHTPLVAAAAPVLAQQLGQENFAIAQAACCLDSLLGVALAPHEDLRGLLCRQ